MLRPLILDDEAKAKVAQVVRYAKGHPYEPNLDAPEDSGDVPGDNPHHICFLNSFRCVFSYTKAEGTTYRDLSVSLPGSNPVNPIYPNPLALYTIADLFGFTGWDGKNIEPVPRGWMFGQDQLMEAIRVVQEM